MAEDNGHSGSLSGIIPDFLHDVIAYFVPGFTIITLLIVNLFIVSGKLPFTLVDIGIVVFIFASVIAYVIGRVLEQAGYMSIHHKKPPFIGKDNKFFIPKWSLLFDEKNEEYTKSFKENLKKKLQEWLKNQDGKNLIQECENNKKDDYFNLIQFYLRERFPQIALYEKKQNATIVLTRSLAVGFFINVLIYPVMLCTFTPNFSFEFSLIALTWIVLNLIFSWVFYKRFRMDQKYHAMYIFEAFIATKRFLVNSTNKSDSTENTTK